MYTEGISVAGDLLDLAVDSKVIQKSGSWFSYGEMRMGQGREQARALLKENQELFQEIRKKVLDIRATHPVGGRPVGAVAGDAEADVEDDA